MQSPHPLPARGRIRGVRPAAGSSCPWARALPGMPCSSR